MFENAFKRGLKYYLHSSSLTLPAGGECRLLQTSLRPPFEA